MARRKSSRKAEQTRDSGRVIKVDTIPDHIFRLMAGYRTESPRNAIKVLMRAACRLDNAGFGARHFLFWLDGETPPDGPNEEGATAMLAMTKKRKEAAVAVLIWWIVLGRNIDAITHLYPKIREWYAAQKAGQRNTSP